MTTKPEPLYKVLAGLVDARERCQKSCNSLWHDRHTNAIEYLVEQYLPSGSGFDSGTTLNLGMSCDDRLTFDTSFHHMNNAGFYDGWTEHVVRVKPNLATEIDMTISGQDRNDIKDYIGQTFDHALRRKVWQDWQGIWCHEDYDEFSKHPIGTDPQPTPRDIPAGHPEIP